MKKIPLVLLFYSLYFFLSCGSAAQETVTVAESPKNKGIKWHDSLFKHLPKNMDTTVVVKDENNQQVAFHQYVARVFNHEALIYQDRGTWRLFPLNDTSIRTMQQLPDREDVVARWERYEAFKTPDTITNWRAKLADISKTLSLADHILVLKSKRKMIITRKGERLRIFDIDLGFKPTGQKLSDGDGRTPEGIYNVDMKTERGDKFYKSFWISYPTVKDRERSKKAGLKAGTNILIHGTTAAKIKAKDWTAGCIALQNKDIDELFELVKEGTIIDIRP